MEPAAPDRNPRRVKAAFIGPFAITLAFIMAVFAAAIHLVENRIREQELAERSTAVAKLFAQKLDKDTNLMRAVLRAMTSNPAVEAAFLRRDRKGLARQGAPLFATLRADHRITHLYFTGPDLVNVYRLHSPGEFGDEINRMTTLRARDLGDTVHGLELGPLGTLTLRLVAPWRRDGNVLGYLEIGEEIEHLIEEIRDSLSVDLLVLVEKRYLLPEQWQRGMALMNRQGDWKRFDTHVALAQTTDQLPAALTNRVFTKLLDGRTVGLEERGRKLHVALLPFEEAGGRHIGELVVIRDVTALESMFRWSTVAVILFSLLAAGAALGIFNVALTRVERDYQRQHDLEHQLLHLNTEHHRILQLEKLSALGTMVGGIAHQLNNPLVGVVNMAELAQREADDPARTRELLGEIRRAGKDCHGFLRRMLAFSKVSSFERKPTPMEPLIEETVLLFRQTESRHLPVEVRLPGEPVVLDVDPILVRHALFNLLLNAAQATPGDGAIVIGLEPSADPGSGAPGWSLSVTDHGRGIAPEAIDKLFVPFFTTRSDGTGLGLPVVQHVALLHDGYVDAANQPEGGARFAIWLPQNVPDSNRNAA